MAEARTAPQEIGGGPGIWEVLIPVLIPILGGVIYAGLRKAYLSFYSRFGASPEDVGLNYIQVLAGSALSILALSLVIALFVQSVMWRRRLRAEWQQWSKETKALADEIDEVKEKRNAGVHKLNTEEALEPDDDEALQQEASELKGQLEKLEAQWDEVQAPRLMPRGVALAALIITIACFVATSIFLIWAVPEDLDSAKRKVLIGEPIGPSNLRVLAMQADRVDVTWIGSGKGPKELQSPKLMFLGHADQVAVFYDPDTARGLRIAERYVFVRVRPDEA
jgi:hypothetical protein